jgi:hypothetical protein
MLDHLRGQIAFQANAKFQFKFVNGEVSTYMIVEADSLGVVGKVGVDTVPIYMPWTSILKITA